MKTDKRCVLEDLPLAGGNKHCAWPSVSSGDCSVFLCSGSFPSLGWFLYTNVQINTESKSWGDPSTDLPGSLCAALSFLVCCPEKICSSFLNFSLVSSTQQDCWALGLSSFWYVQRLALSSSTYKSKFICSLSFTNHCVVCCSVSQNDCFIEFVWSYFLQYER